MSLLNLFAGVDERSLLKLISQTQTLRSLCLRDTHLVDDALYSFSGSLLEILDVSNTMVSLQFMKSRPFPQIMDVSVSEIHKFFLH